MSEQAKCPRATIEATDEGGYIVRCGILEAGAKDAKGLATCLAHELQRRLGDLNQIAALTAERDALKEALTPSGDTKAAYIGRFGHDVESRLMVWRANVPWTTIKDIMRAIRERATQALKEQSDE